MRGFILTPTYRVAGGRAEVHLYAVLETGEPALIVDDRFPPYFFVRAADRDALRRAAPERRVTESPLLDVRRRAGAPRRGRLPGDVPPLRARLAERRRRLLRGRRAVRLPLPDRPSDPRARSRSTGPSSAGPASAASTGTRSSSPPTSTPRLRVLSFDIETSLDGRVLYSIAAAGHGGERVWLVRPARRAARRLPDGAGARWCRTSAPASQRFLAHLRAADPDVLTGWNVVDFDLTVLRGVARRRASACALGRTDEEVECGATGFTREPRVILSGRQVLDGLALLRSAFIRLDDYRLETAAAGVPRQGQADRRRDRGARDRGGVPGRSGAARRLQPAGRAARARDPRAHAARRAGGAAEPPHRHAARPRGRQIASVDSLYLGELRARGRVAPSVHARTPRATVIAGGARARLRAGPLPEHPRVRLQEPVPEHHPHLQHRSADLRAAERAAPGRRPHPHAERRRVPRDEPASCPTLVARLWDERAAGPEAAATRSARRRSRS